MKPLDPNAEFRRILVICTRQIGDVLLTTPLIRAAKQRWPNARIDVLGFAGTLGMLKGNPDVAALIEVEPGSGWLRSLPLIWRLWRHYDLALITQRSDRAHLYGWIAARVRAGLVPGQVSLAWWKRKLLDHAAVVNGEETHVVLEKFELLKPWHAAPSHIEVVAPADAALPQDIESALRAPYVVIHVPSMWRFKQWPLEHFQQVIKALLADRMQIVLTGSAAARDQSQVAAMLGLGAAPLLLDASGRLDFNQLGKLLRRASLYVGPDTSITHLAAACGAPVIALFGPTHPQVWGPWANGLSESQPFERRALLQQVGNVTLLQGPGDCVPCRQEGCERHPESRSACLQGLEPQRVIVLARQRLGVQRHGVADGDGGDG